MQAADTSAFVRQSESIQAALDALIELAERPLLPKYTCRCWCTVSEKLDDLFEGGSEIAHLEDAILKRVELPDDVLPTYHDAAVKLCIDGVLRPFSAAPICPELFASLKWDIPANDRELLEQVADDIGGFFTRHPLKTLHDVQIGMRLELKDVRATAPFAKTVSSTRPQSSPEWLSAGEIAKRFNLSGAAAKTLANDLTSKQEALDGACREVLNRECRQPKYKFNVNAPAVRKIIENRVRAIENSLRD